MKPIDRTRAKNVRLLQNRRRRFCKSLTLGKQGNRNREKANMEWHLEWLNASPPAVAGGTAWRIGSLRRSPDRGASEWVGC